MKKYLCLLSLLACGDDGATPDPVIDAAIDAPTSGPVSLTYREYGVGVEGVDVYFQNADGSLVGKVATDANGFASQVMTSGGTVTILQFLPPEPVDPDNPPDPDDPVDVGAYALHTYAAVKAGDELTIEGGSPMAGDDIVINGEIPGMANATGYHVATTCTSDGDGGGSKGGPDYQLVLDGDKCKGSADFLIIAHDGSVPIGSIYKPNVSVSDQARISFGEPYTAVPTTSITFSNMPVAVADSRVRTELYSPRGVLFNSEATPISFTAGAGTAMLRHPRASNTASAAYVSHRIPSAPLAFHMSVLWGPSSEVSTLTYDGATTFLPNYTQAPTYDATTQRIVWQSSGSTVAADFAVAFFYAARQSPEQEWYWKIAAPYDGTAIRLPALPSDIAKFLPLANDYFLPVTLDTGKITGGYDAVRENAFNLLGTRTDDVGLPPGSGSLDLVMLSPFAVPRRAPETLRRPRVLDRANRW